MSKIWYLLATVIISGGFVILSLMSYRTFTAALSLLLAGLGFGYLMACLLGRYGNAKKKHDDQ